ncbi:MAG: hypothetical protein WCQ50_05805 [Spirochaetota bacterium]
MKPGSRIVVAFLVSDILLFGSAFAWAFFTHSATQIIPSLAVVWELSSAARLLIAWIAPAQLIAAVLALISLKGDQEPPVASVMVPALVIALLLFALVSIGSPLIENSLVTVQTTSQRFNTSLDTLREALDKGQTAEASLKYAELEAISPKDERLPPLARRLSARKSNESRAIEEAVKSEAETTGNEASKDSNAAKEAWVKAQAAFEKADWYNAHWQATLALRLDPGLVEAKRLSARAWEEISKAAGLTSLDVERSRFYSEKLRGYGLLHSGDFVAAWHIFDSLSRQHDDDVEVRRYLKESLSGLRQTSFWRDEVDEAFRASALPRLFIRMKEDSGRETLLAAKEAAWTKDAAYLSEAEWLERLPDGSGRIVRTRWAKIVTGRLYFMAAERNEAGKVWRPEVAAFAKDGSASSLAASSLAASGFAAQAPASVEFAFTPDKLRTIAALRSAPETLSALEILGVLGMPDSMTFNPEALLTEFLRRLGVAFALAASAIVGVVLGIRLRPSTRQRRAFPVLAFALFAACVCMGWFFALWLDELALRWVVMLAPTLAAAALSVGIRSLWLAAAAMLALGLGRGSWHLEQGINGNDGNSSVKSHSKRKKASEGPAATAPGNSDPETGLPDDDPFAFET